MVAFGGLLRKLFGNGQAAELAVDQAWQELVGHSPILYGVPKDTLAEMAGRLTTMPAPTGEVIVRQGDPGDAFYLIVRGAATVTRQESPDAKPVPVATLGKGFWFGEEALLSQQPRNATVTMAEDGMRVQP